LADANIERDRLMRIAAEAMRFEVAITDQN